MDPTNFDRQTRRKAATRTRILTAADELFERKGFASTSIAEISEAADVAVRTIYLHFNSKAAILLAYADDWIEQLTERLCERPADEPVAQSVTVALAGMAEAGWTDDRGFEDMTQPHPLMAALSSGDLEIAGHILQTWVRAQTTLADHFRTSGGFPPESLEPRIRASAMFATWLTTVMSYQDEFDGKVRTNASTYTLSIGVMAAFGRGLDQR